MTTLKEARDRIHEIEQQRLAFLTRRGRGELVRRLSAENLAHDWVRGARDTVQLLPHRYAAILANRYLLDHRAVHDVLTDVFEELLRALARNNADPSTVLDALPSVGWPPGARKVE